MVGGRGFMGHSEGKVNGQVNKLDGKDKEKIGGKGGEEKVDGSREGIDGSRNKKGMHGKGLKRKIREKEEIDGSEEEIDGSRKDKKDVHGKGFKQDGKDEEKIDGKGDEAETYGSRTEPEGSRNYNKGMHG